MFEASEMTWSGGLLRLECRGLQASVESALGLCGIQCTVALW